MKIQIALKGIVHLQFFPLHEEIKLANNIKIGIFVIFVRTLIP